MQKCRPKTHTGVSLHPQPHRAHRCPACQQPGSALFPVFSFLFSLSLAVQSSPTHLRLQEEAPLTESPRRIDSHFHFWDPATRDYPWMPPELKRAYGPDDLQPLLAKNGFAAAVLVQTVSDVDET